MPLLQRRLESIQICDNISIVFPDDGAYKRFNSFFPTWPTIVCNKVRDGDKRIVTIRDGNAQHTHTHTCAHTRAYRNSCMYMIYTLLYNKGITRGKDCVIVDDLVQTGGTLLECVKVRLF